MKSFSAAIKLAEGRVASYTAVGDYAAAQLAKIAEVCEVELVDGERAAAPGEFHCRIVELPRAEVENVAHPEPGVITLFEPYIIIKLSADLSRSLVYVVPDGGRSRKAMGFMWRRLFYLALLPLTAHCDCSVVHGILAEKAGRGVVISGPSGIGKSTAARRLPEGGWNVLADDCLLATRSANGDFLAQPVPTWSVFYANSAPERTWNCEKVVPLKAIFLLDRGAERAERLDFQQTLIGFTRSVGDMTRMLSGRVEGERGKFLYRRAFNLASEMAKKLPAYHLFATLEGKFWEAMTPCMENTL